MDIFHHFNITNSEMGWGLSNLVFAQFKCLLFFTIFAILVRFKISFFYRLFQFLYSFVRQISQETLNDNSSKFHKPLLILFMFILFSNLYGLIPGSFSFNSHLVVTGCWAVLVWFYSVINGIRLNGSSFFRHFAPSGVPKPLLLLVIPMEVISFMLKPVSLALRLFINVMVGHIIMTLAESMISAGKFGKIGAIFCLLGVTVMEFFVSILQAYIFLVMSANMLKSCVDH